MQEGDGIQVLRCWRYLLPMFISSGHKNYAAKAALNLLLQHDYVLSPCEASELIWCCFINVSGQPRYNIPTETHGTSESCIENSIHGLRVNKTASTIERVARALGTISLFLQNHQRPGADKDMKKLIHELRSVFSSHQNRTHRSFPSPCDPLHPLKQEVKTWIVKHITILTSCYVHTY